MPYGINEIRCLNPRLKILPFNSTNKFMISANRLEPHDLSILDSECTILIILKGAPDIVIQRCSSYKTNDDRILPLTAQIKEKLFNRQEILGKENNILIFVFIFKFEYYKVKVVIVLLPCVNKSYLRNGMIK